MDMLPPLLARFIPALPKISQKEMVRIGIGAFIGIGLAALLSSLVMPGSALPYLIPPIGASTVLAFGVPASPLAQPWSVVGGNMVSAAVGVTVALLVPNVILAAALAVAFAILAMILLRCLHPPGGAAALTAVLGPPAIHAAGYGFVFVPTGLNSLLMVLVAIAYNNMTGHRYPHVPPQPAAAPPVHKTADPLPSERAGISTADVEAALDRYGDILDISPEDLEAVLHEAQISAFHRRAGAVTAGTIMSRHVVAVGSDTTLGEALSSMTEHDFRLLPVVSASGELEGVVTQADLLRAMAGRHEADESAPVSAVMTRRVVSAREDQLIGTLVPLLSDRGLHGLPVVDANNRLSGILTQSDLIAALFAKRAELEPA